MDILKVLSRGIKQPSKNANVSNTIPTRLPSAGAKPHPQLFHDDVGEARGKKRKRNKDEAVQNDAVELPEVDFFAARAVEAPAQKQQPGSARRSENDDDDSTRSAGPSRLLDDDECRQLLRSHRLKITVLSNPQIKSIQKSKKAKKGAVIVKAKDDLRQLHPQPLISFADLRSVYNLSNRLSENLARESYRVPTEVQMGSLPLLIRPDLALDGVRDLDVGGGIDFMAVAPTGSGKTMSFLIPAVNNIIRRRAQERAHGVHELEAVVVAPTRELAFQILNEGRKLIMGTGLKIVGMKKGMQLSAERVEEDLESSEEDASDAEEESDEEHDEGPVDSRRVAKADVLITTPMLLLNFLTAGRSGGQKILPTVRNLILDEADVLLDPLFRDQTMGIWSACTNSSLRLTFWSATMGSSIENLVVDKLASRAEELGLAAAPLVRLVVGLKDTAVPNISHKLIYAGTEQGKLIALRQLLHPTSGSDSGPALRPPFLVFTQTIERAAALHDELQYDIPAAAGGSSRIATLHSGLSDAARAAIMRRFRAGEIWVLTTTDVLARGVDFAGVNGVVNYDVPGSSAAYVHRAGRTGRAGREGGVAVTFYTKEDIPFVKSVANVIAASERQAGKTGDDVGVQKWLLDALPKVSKANKKRLKERGVEVRRTGAVAKITSKSGWERRKENNRRGAIEGSKHRGRQDDVSGDEESGSEWGGIDD